MRRDDGWMAGKFVKVLTSRQPMQILVEQGIKCGFLGLTGMTERSKFQKNVIRNYYDNRQSIALQRAQEIVTELYLSEGKKRQRYWKSLETHLLNLGTKQTAIDHLIQQDDPQIAAQLVERIAKAL